MSEHRVRFAALFDAEVRPHNERFRAAAAITRGEDVLDVGCGTGESTREAALASETGTSWVSTSRRRPSPGPASWVARRSRSPTRRPTRSRHQGSTSCSAGSGRCSSPIRRPPSPTSPAPCGPVGAWCCSSGRNAPATSGTPSCTTRWRPARPHRPPERTSPSATRSRPARCSKARVHRRRVQRLSTSPSATGPDSATATGFALGLKDVQELGPNGRRRGTAARGVRRTRDRRRCPSRLPSLDREGGQPRLNSRFSC